MIFGSSNSGGDGICVGSIGRKGECGLSGDGCRNGDVLIGGGVRRSLSVRIRPLNGVVGNIGDGAILVGDIGLGSVGRLAASRGGDVGRGGIAAGRGGVLGD